MSTRAERRIYGGTDPREAPAFRIVEAAHFLWVSEKSMRRWAAGEVGRKPVIRIANATDRALSFFNLAELHVLSFLRDQRVSLQRIRRAVTYLEQELGPECRHPLLAMDLLTDGVNVFVERLTHGEALVNISQHGQLAMRALLEAHLKRIERDARTKQVLRLYPFAWPVRSTEDAENQPRPVTIDPRIAFGRPVLTGTRVPTTEIASRIRAGEPMQDIAEDMHLELRQVEDALRYHIEAA